MTIGGERKDMPLASPRYTAIYELESPEVLVSDVWGRAVEAGRWPGEVRPVPGKPIVAPLPPPRGTNADVLDRA